MDIQIWSDVVCPWCYIGKRRLEAALAEFPHPVEVTWRSFLLDPGAPQEASETIAEHLGKKYGGGAAGGQQMIDQIEAVAAEEGLLFRLGEARRGSTVDAHRLLHLARSEGGSEQQGRLKEELLAAYFLRAENVADHEVLRRTAAEVGLDPARVEAVLGSTEYADAVHADVAEAGRLGATGVPFYVVGQRYGVSGAQPVEAFTEVLTRAWAETHPTLEVLPATSTDQLDATCGPDGCAI